MIEKTVIRKSTAPHKCYVCLHWRVRGKYVEPNRHGTGHAWACDRCIRDFNLK